MENVVVVERVFEVWFDIVIFVNVVKEKKVKDLKIKFYEIIKSSCSDFLMFVKIVFFVLVVK